MYLPHPLRKEYPLISIIFLCSQCCAVMYLLPQVNYTTCEELLRHLATVEEMLNSKNQIAVDEDSTLQELKQANVRFLTRAI